MMRILLLGKNGQVGWELQRALAPLGELVVLGRAECDFGDRAALRERVRSERPDVIVNAAAYTAVDRAESEADVAQRINAEAPAVLADEAQAGGALLVHYSTDYVFDGSQSAPYAEDDAPRPLSVYGRSKLAGEEAVRASTCRHLIFRTSWVFGPRGGNFLKTILRLAAERDALNVVADQFGAPTSAELIADVTAHAIAAVAGGRAEPGLYHLAAGGETNWHGYARFVVETAARLGAPLRLTSGRIAAIATEAYPLPAARPKNSRLDTRRLQAQFGLVPPDWRHYVERTLNELIRP